MQSQRARDEAASVMGSLRRIVRELRASSHTARQDLDIGGAQLFVLSELAAEPRISLRRLSERTLTDPSSVSVVVARLVERGLVTRRPDPADGRSALLALSARGRSLLARAPEPFQIRLVAALHALPRARLRQLDTALAEVVRAVGVEDGPSTMFFAEDSEQKKKKDGQRGRRAS